MHLDAILVDEPLTGGLEPRLGDAHLRTLTIMGFPSQTWPGLLDELNRLAFPYRWSTRAICLDKTDAAKVLTRIRRQWFAKRKSIMAILKEVMTNEASALLDTDAANKALDADARAPGARLRCSSARPMSPRPSRSGTRMPAVADEQLRLVEKIIQGRDFTCMRETRERGRGLARQPARACLRQCPPAADLDPQPRPHDAALGGLGRAGTERASRRRRRSSSRETEGATPFRFSLHVGDVGHTLVVGPTGAGKSVLLALMALQFRRYAGRAGLRLRFRRLDPRRRARHGRRLARSRRRARRTTTAEPVALQPLARIDDAGERAWAAEWVAALLAREGVTVTPELKEHLWSALTSLASAPPSERTLTGLSVLLQSNALKQALQPYTVGGPWGRLLDAEAERLGDAEVQAFETEGLIGSGAAPAVLSYLFHRIEDRLRRPPHAAHRRRGLARARRSTASPASCANG